MKTEKARCVVMSRHQNPGQNDDLLIVNESFKYVAKFKHFGSTVTNLNCIREEIKV